LNSNAANTALIDKMRVVYYGRFVEMISMIVSFSVDKDRMQATVTSLGFRHVRYGVRPHHIPIMGQVSLRQRT